jgi:integrase/recombinase XerD
MNEIVQTERQPIQIDQNPAAVYLASLRADTGRRTMRQVLNLVAGLLSGGEADALTFAWHTIRYQHVVAVRSRLAQAYKPATVNKSLAALRGVLRVAWQLGQMSAEDYHKAASVRNVRADNLPAGRELSQGEISALISACERDPSPAGVRDAAIIALMYACGLRRAEVVSLDLADYDATSGRLIIRGKGGKERSAWLSNGAARAMADWLEVRGDAPGALFVAIRKGGRFFSLSRMTPKTIYKMLAKRARQAGVARFSPHDLRRTFIGDLLDAGVDVVTVARMAGHANITTTARYDRRSEETKRKAANLLHVPYRGKSN